jgi:hypothetical protein
MSWQRRSKRLPSKSILPTTRNGLLEQALNEFEEEEDEEGIQKSKSEMEKKGEALLDQVLDEFDQEVVEETKMGANGIISSAPDLDTILDDALDEFDFEEEFDLEVGGESSSNLNDTDGRNQEVTERIESKSKNHADAQPVAASNATESRRRVSSMRQRAFERRDRAARRRRLQSAPKRQHRIYEMAPDQAAHMKTELLEQAERDKQEENGEQILMELDKISAEVSIARGAVEEIQRHQKKLKRQLSDIKKANRIRRPRCEKSISSNSTADTNTAEDKKESEEESNGSAVIESFQIASSATVEKDKRKTSRLSLGASQQSSSSDKHSEGLLNELQILQPQLAEAKEVLEVLSRRRANLLERQKILAAGETQPPDKEATSKVGLKSFFKGERGKTSSLEKSVVHHGVTDEAAQHTGSLRRTFSTRATEVLSSLWHKRPLLAERQRKNEANKTRKMINLLRQAGLTEEEAFLTAKKANSRKEASSGLSVSFEEDKMGPPSPRSAWEERDDERRKISEHSAEKNVHLDTSKGKAEADWRLGSSRPPPAVDTLDNSTISEAHPTFSGRDFRNNWKINGTVNWKALADELTLIPADELAKQRKSERDQRARIVRLAGSKHGQRGEQNVAFASEVDMLQFDNDQPPKVLAGEKFSEQLLKPLAEFSKPSLSDASCEIVSNSAAKEEDTELQNFEDAERDVGENDDLSLHLSLESLERSAVGGDLHALWRGALPSERDWEQVVMKLPELAAVELDDERQVFDMLRSHAPVEGMMLLEMSLAPNSMRDFAIAAHAFIRFWSPSRRYFVKERCFRDIKSSDFVTMLCCALRDVHVAHLASVLSVLWLFTLIPEHRRAVLRDGAVGAVVGRLHRHTGQFRAVELSALTLVCTVLWSPDASLLRKKRRMVKIRGKLTQTEEQQNHEIEVKEEKSSLAADVASNHEKPNLVTESASLEESREVSIDEGDNSGQSNASSSNNVLNLVSESTITTIIEESNTENIEAGRDNDVRSAITGPLSPVAPARIENLLLDDVGRVAFEAKAKKRAAKELRQKRRNEQRAARNDTLPSRQSIHHDSTREYTDEGKKKRKKKKKEKKIKEEGNKHQGSEKLS